MSDHFTRSSQRRIHRLNFRSPFEEVNNEDSLKEDTLKVPTATLKSMRRWRDFLPASPTTEEGLVQNEYSPVTPPVVDPGPNKKRLPSKLPPEPEAKLPTKPLFPLPTGESSRKLVAPSDPITPPSIKERISLVPPFETQQRDAAMLDTMKSPVMGLSLRRPSLADDETIRLNGINLDDPEWEKHTTIPMMVLKEMSSKDGQLQPEMKSEVSGVASAAGLVGFGSIIGTILKFGSTFLIQYGFGAGGYGLYTLSLSFINLITSIFNLGLDDAMVRYVAIYRGKQQFKSLQGLLLFCTTLAGLAGILGALLLLFFTPQLVVFWIGLKHHQIENGDMLNRSITLLQVMAPIVPLTTMQVMWFAGLRGFKAIKWRVLTSSILQPILLMAMMLVVVRFFHDRDGITMVGVVSFISTLVGSVLNMYFLLKQVSKVATPEPEHYEVREWLTFATLNFLTTVIDTVLDSIDTILLAAFGVSDVALGQYGAAMRLSNFIALPLSSINNIFAPTIAELHSKGELKKLESMFKIVTKWTITFSLPIFLVVVLFSPYLLELPGASFAGAWPLLVAFAFGGLVNAGTGAVGYMLLMTGYQRISFINSLVAVVVNIALGLYLTPRYGAMGTAVSTGLAICAQNFMRLLQVRVFLKMHPYRWDMLKPLGAGLISSAITGVLLLLLYASHVETAFLVRHAVLSVQLLLIPVFLACYVGLVIAFKASPEDEIVLSALRKKFMRGKGKGKGKKNSQKKV